MNEDKGQTFGSQRRSAPTREAIAERAYELWQQQGCLPGCHQQNWEEAERELTGLSTSKWHETQAPIEEGANRRK